MLINENKAYRPNADLLEYPDANKISINLCAHLNISFHLSFKLFSLNLAYNNNENRYDYTYFKK